MSQDNIASKKPTPDQAEHNAFFPSPYSLNEYVPPTTDFDRVEHAHQYSGPKKILMVGTGERYMAMTNGTFFSTGNHPVETLLPLHHITAAGIGVDVATIGANPVKFELWAMPKDDRTVADTYQALLPQFIAPLDLSEVVSSQLGPNSDYIGIFIPGGHGALNGLPHSKDVQALLDWALDHDKFIITLCHGPGALVASALGRDTSRFSGYSVAVFPDALDKKANVDIGYIPGDMHWYVAEELTKQGLNIVNDDMTGAVHQDRKLLTGDSPLASNKLGKLAADALINELT